jgi:hypothetical protein
MTSDAVQDRTVTELTAGRGRGPGSLLLAPAELGGHCHVPSCNEQIDPSRLMCRHHWYRVPKQLRDQRGQDAVDRGPADAGHLVDPVLADPGLDSPGRGCHGRA